MGLLAFRVLSLLAAFCMAAFVNPCCRAGYTLTIAPDGAGNVVAFGSGTLNTSALNMQDTGGPFSAALLPDYVFGASILTGGYSQRSFQSSGSVTGPFTYGTGGPYDGIKFATSSTGDLVGLSSLKLVVPVGYVSGDPLSNQAMWANQSISSLQLTPGTYNYTWGSGASADFYTINITTTAVPEPGTVSLSLVALSGTLLLRYRKRKFWGTRT
jgi:hypothetical protein